MVKTRKQLSIKGTEAKVIPEISTAAERYVEARDERMALTEREVETREALVQVMNKHKVDAYRDADATPPLLVMLIQGRSKVKVRREVDEAEAEG